jgi:hypothetical protein
MNTQSDKPKAGDLYWMRWVMPTMGLYFLVGAAVLYYFTDHRQFSVPVCVAGGMGIVTLMTCVYVEWKLREHRYNEYRKACGRINASNEEIRELLRQCRRHPEANPPE